jgi:hypothetical protein
MLIISLLVLLLPVLGAAGPLGPVDAGRQAARGRQWQTGTWMANVDARTLALETADVRIELREPDGTPQDRALSPKPDTRVVFAMDNTTVLVRDEKGVERSLRIVRTIDKKYLAVGGGHLLRAVAEDGRVLTLEDGSVWDVSPSDQFKTVGWGPGAVMSVIRLPAGDDYGYEVDNIDVDEGAQANYRPKR